MTQQLTPNGRPVPGGFTGTARSFLDWIQDHLSYGVLTISEPAENPEQPRKGPMRWVRMVTGGFSDDERLLSRVENSLFSAMFWKSTHRGGLYVYLLTEDQYQSANETTWLRPETDVFETLYWARTVRIKTKNVQFETRTEHGLQLAFTEPAGDHDEPEGVLTVIPLETTPDTGL